MYNGRGGVDDAEMTIGRQSATGIVIFDIGKMPKITQSAATVGRHRC
jgi:hypothetical protein